MKKTILTTAIQNFNAGMVSDGNLIEFPPNSAKVLQNVDYADNDTLVRRPGLGATTWSTSDTCYQTFMWEYSPQNFVLVVVDLDKIEVRSTSGVVLASWGPWPSGIDIGYGSKDNDFMVAVNSSNEISYVYEEEVPTGAAASSITASKFFHKLSEAKAAGTVTMTQTEEVDSVVSSQTKKMLVTELVYSGNTYIRKACYESVAPNVSSTSYPLPTSFATSPGSWYQFASFKNSCVITNELGIAWCLWADTDTNDLKFYADYVNLSRRVYEDLPDGVGVDEQPASSVSNDALEYNLRNRGWSTSRLSDYLTNKSKWPAKNMIVWRGKDSTGAWSVGSLDLAFFGTSSAPTGALVVSTYDYDKASPSTVCAAFGRYFYAGFQGGILGNSVMYSQTIEGDEFIGDRVGACYAVNDPTSEYLNEGTAIDGGYIKVEGATKIVKLLRFKDGILIFARNGVWYLTGIQGQVFAGNAFNMYKVTDKGILNGHAAEEMEDRVLYAAEDGIYGIAVNPETRSLASVNVTDNKISKFYKENVTTLAETYSSNVFTRTAVGPYICAVKDKIKKDILFLLGSASTSMLGTWGSNAGGIFLNEPTRTVSDTVLVYNYRRDSWRFYELGDGSTGSVKIEFGTLNSDGSLSLRDRKGKPYKFTRDGTAASNNFKDDVWTASGDSTLTQSYYNSVVDIATKNAMVDPDKQLACVTTHFINSDYKVGADPVTTGSCYMSVIWDNAASGYTVRQSPEQQAYRNVPNRLATSTTVADQYETNYTKLRIRGHGHHFVIRYASEDDKNFKLIGYTLDVAYPTRDLYKLKGAD